MLQRHCPLVCRSFNNTLANSPYTISWWIFHAIASCALSRQTRSSVLKHVDCDAVDDHTAYIKSLQALNTMINSRETLVINKHCYDFHTWVWHSDHVLGDGGLLPRGMWDQLLPTVIDRNMKESMIKIGKFFYSLNSWKCTLRFLIFLTCK